MSHEIHQQATARILNALEQGRVPWQKPWLGHKNDGPPTNILTGLSFRGITRLLLQMAHFRSKWWGELRVWTAFGYHVKPHQEGTQVFLGEVDNLQSQTVFNAEQVEGAGFLVTETTGKRLPDYEAAERVIAATGADIRHLPMTGAFYYRLPKDYIEMPLKSQFLNGTGGLPSYYGTLLHEATHWSEHRLNWLADLHLTIKERYAIGEMRAELGSCFLSDEIGIPLCHNTQHHGEFVGQWMDLMRADHSLVFRVAAAASEAAKFILSFSQEQRQTA